MKSEKVKDIFKNGEGITIEFKQSRSCLNRDVFESVCAFLNRNGGHIFLGVNDTGAIVGVDAEAVDKIKTEFITLMNNPQKISPTFYLSVEEVEVDGKIILHIIVPESSQVHRCNGRIYDRNEDGDIDITDNTNIVAGMYGRKQGTYVENRIFPFAEISELKAELLVKVRQMAVNERANHPWKSMDDIDLLKSAGLYLKDRQSGKEGITLGGILVFGSEELIHAVLPHYRTDAILRKVNTDRYDDRDDIRVNLLESFERLMHFVSKHLNDNFYLEGDRRISLRDKIFREVVSNLLIHRDFANPFPAKLVIEKDRVFTENSNKANGNGVIDLDNFSPFPKNPTIAKFFKEIGWVDELGSGVRNIYKYNKIYSGGGPTFIEGDVFKTIIPLISQTSEHGSEHVGEHGSEHAGNHEDRTQEIVEYCKIPRSRGEIQDFVGMKSRRYFSEKLLNPLVRGGLLKLTIPENPKNPKQKYYSLKK